MEPTTKSLPVPPDPFDAPPIALAVDLVEAIEGEAPLADALARLAGSLRRLFDADAVAACAVPTTAASPAPWTIDAAPGLLAAAACGGATARLVWADRWGVRPVDAFESADEIAPVVPGRHDLWVAHQTGDAVVAVLVRGASLPAGERDAAHGALDRLVAAVAARRRASDETRRRLQRATTLSAVVEEIASRLDVDQVLRAIVERARDLLGADAAYLADVDEARREVTVRVAVGLRDDAWRPSVALGTGLVGAVAASRRPMATPDYLHDHRFVHTDEIDRAVTREGIHGAVSAPMRTGGRVHGVLGVANHRPTEFDADDLELIGRLADGAAIALENARLYAAQAALVDQLRLLNDVAARQNDALRRSLLVHDQLTALVLQGRGVDDIARRLAALIGNPVVVLGSYFQPIAGTAGEDAARAARRLAAVRERPRFAAELARLKIERRPIHFGPDPALGLSESAVVAPILAGADLLGYVLVAEARRPFAALDFQALEQAATVFALELTRERLVAEVENRLRGDFVHDVVAASFDAETLVERANRLGHDLRLPQVVLAAETDTPHDGAVGVIDPDEGALRLERALRTSLDRLELMAQTSIVEGAAVALVALPERAGSEGAGERALLRAIHGDVIAFLSPRTASIGVGRLCRAPGDLRRGYQEAVQALRSHQRLGLTGVAEYDRLGVERILTQLPDRHVLARYADDVLGPLVAYDAAHGSELVPTLEAHLAHGCRQRATAEALGIHVNSLQYRLRRIQEIGEVDLEDPETRLNLHLALRTLQVLHALDPRT